MVELTVTKMGGTHCGKCGNSLWQKWVDFAMAKIGGVGVIESVAKMGGAHRDKNEWNSLCQKWVELTVTKMDGTHLGKNW